jgi:hypothetical protein
MKDIKGQVDRLVGNLEKIFRIESPCLLPPYCSRGWSSSYGRINHDQCEWVPLFPDWNGPSLGMFRLQKKDENEHPRVKHQAV